MQDDIQPLRQRPLRQRPEWQRADAGRAAGRRYPGQHLGAARERTGVERTPCGGHGRGRLHRKPPGRGPGRGGRQCPGDGSLQRLAATAGALEWIDPGGAREHRRACGRHPQQRVGCAVGGGGCELALPPRQPDRGAHSTSTPEPSSRRTRSAPSMSLRPAGRTASSAWSTPRARRPMGPCNSRPPRTIRSRPSPRTAASKIGADQVVLSFVRSLDLRATVVRPFNTFAAPVSALGDSTIISQALHGDVVRLALGPRGLHLRQRHRPRLHPPGGERPDPR